MPKKKPQRYVPFQEVLAALLDDTQVFPVLYLHQFSDLEGPDFENLKEIWPRVNPTRRAALLEDLEKLAENETIVSFDNLAAFALQDSDPRVRVNAINLLWEAENARLAPRFIDMLNHDPDAAVRSAAAAALGKYVYMGEVETLPAPLLRQVEEALLHAYRESDDQDVRRRALESLGYSGRPEVPALIRKAYASHSRDWLISALYAISRSADDRWAPEVNRMLHHPDLDVQYEAVRAAGELELASARRPLLAMLNNEQLDRELRLQVIWSLAKIGGEGVGEKLEELLDATDDEEEALFLEEAIELLAFTEDSSIFRMMDLDEPEDPARLKLDRPLSSAPSDVEAEDLFFADAWDDEDEDEGGEDDDVPGERPSGPSRDVSPDKPSGARRRRPR